MVYKNKDIKIDKLYCRKLIFSVILLVYFSGLCAGCSFALKNARNFDFVQKVTFVQNLSEIENMAVSACSARFLARDIIFILLILTFKYSGVLKGLCLCIPFIMAVQNTCIYTIFIYKVKVSVFNLIFNYILKDTAVSFMIILYLYVIVTDIVYGRTNIKKDMKKTLIYSTGIILIYIIDTVIKMVIHPFR